MTTYADLGMTTDSPGSITYRGHRIHEDDGQFTVLGFQHKAPFYTAAMPHAVMAWIDAQAEHHEGNLTPQPVDVSVAIQALLQVVYRAWTTRIASIDGRGNYHARNRIHIGPSAPWNTTLKQRYSSVNLSPCLAIFTPRVKV